MSAYRYAMLGVLVLAALSVPALTQTPNPSSQPQDIQNPASGASQSTKSPYGLPASYDGVTLYYPDTGRTVATHMNNQDMQMAVQHAMPLKGPVMIVMSGGQPYVVQDMKQQMPDGTPMIVYFEQRMQ
jgi:hypothetical protein